MSDGESDFSVNDQNEIDEIDEEIGLDSEEEDFIEEPEENSRKRKTPDKKSPVKSAKKAKTESAASTAKKGKKTKEEKTGAKKELTEKQGYGVILQYINEQNKPFNAQTIFDNLHKTVKKAHVVRILAQLAQDGKIIEKEYGKSKVYFADQSQFPTVDEAELKGMDDEISNLEEEVKELQGQVATFRNVLKELDSALTDEELQKGIATMTEETQRMEERVTTLQGAEVIDPRELDVLRKEITKAQKIWRQRRGICREMAGNLADSMEKKDEEIYEMIGIETEEELGLPNPFKR